jgi:hypothetical protein
VVGAYLRNINTLVWTVPLNGVSANSHLLFYYITEGKWAIENFSVRYINNWTTSSSLIWNNLAGLGFTLWSDFGTSAFTDYITTGQNMMISNLDGLVYAKSGESDKGLTDFDGYRIEPVINFSGDGNFCMLNEIWFNFVESGDFNLYCQYRGGDALKECTGAAWEPLNSISHNDPQNAVIYTNKNNRWHQIKWGTSNKNERFSVNAIEFKYVPHGRY